MILGRNTQQWLALITALAAFISLVIATLGQPAILNLPPEVISASGVILDGAVILLGIVIAFIANTRTTPTSDPQLTEGTLIRVTNAAGDVVAHKPVPGPNDTVIPAPPPEG